MIKVTTQNISWFKSSIVKMQSPSETELLLFVTCDSHHKMNYMSILCFSDTRNQICELQVIQQTKSYRPFNSINYHLIQHFLMVELETAYTPLPYSTSKTKEVLWKVQESFLKGDQQLITASSSSVCAKCG